MRLLRTLSGLTIAAVCLAGCGGTGGSSPAATPQFVEPAAATGSSAPAEPTETAEAPAGAAKAGQATPTQNVKPPKARPSKAPVSAVKYAFPVDASNVDWHPTHSKYPATDLFADCGERFVATTTGVVLEVSLKDEYVKGRPDGPLNGGLSVSILGDDGVRYYGSHLSKVQAGIKPGVRVKAGQLLGKVGRTGNANNVCHLHYGISPPCAKTGDWKVRRGVIWPSKYLKSWRNGANRSPVAEVKSWKAANNCKA